MTTQVVFFYHFRHSRDMKGYHDNKSFFFFYHFRHKSDIKGLSPAIETIKKKANSYFEKEHYTKAIYLYNQAIARASSSSVLYGNRAAAYMKRKWYV